MKTFPRFMTEEDLDQLDPLLVEASFARVHQHTQDQYIAIVSASRGDLSPPKMINDTPSSGMLVLAL